MSDEIKTAAGEAGGAESQNFIHQFIREDTAPGGRFAGGAVGDQKRVMTPEKAGRSGCDYLVMGRPITQAEDPVEAYRQAIREFLGQV